MVLQSHRAILDCSDHDIFSRKCSSSGRSRNEWRETLKRVPIKVTLENALRWRFDRGLHNDPTFRLGLDPHQKLKPSPALERTPFEFASACGLIQIYGLGRPR